MRETKKLRERQRWRARQRDRQRERGRQQDGYRDRKWANHQHLKHGPLFRKKVPQHSDSSESSQRWSHHRGASVWRKKRETSESVRNTNSLRGRLLERGPSFSNTASTARRYRGPFISRLPTFLKPIVNMKCFYNTDCNVISLKTCVHQTGFCASSADFLHTFSWTFETLLSSSMSLQSNLKMDRPHDISNGRGETHALNVCLLLMLYMGEKKRRNLTWFTHAYITIQDETDRSAFSKLHVQFPSLHKNIKNNWIFLTALRKLIEPMLSFREKKLHSG